MADRGVFSMSDFPSQAMTATPTPDQLQAWADEAQACIDSGEVVVSDYSKAHATIMALREHASLKARIAELEAENHHLHILLGSEDDQG
jgi:hypothetical protein